MDRVNNPYHDEKVFWPYHKDKALTILRGELPSPSLVEVDPTGEACNQACPHCCFGSSPHRKMVLVDVEMLLGFLKEVYECGTYAFELVGGGEPTNHPRIIDIIRGISLMSNGDSERPHIGLVTNGVRLDRVFPVAELLDFVRVSLDAPDATVYNPAHGLDSGSNHFDKVIGNVKSLVEIVGGERVRIGYLVVPPYNHGRETIRDVVRLADNLGVEHIAFRPAFLADTKTDRVVWKEIAEVVCEVKREYRDGFVLGGIGGSWDYAVGEKSHPTGLCRTRPLVLTIKADGTIPHCFLFRERLAERPAIGHISDGFKEIWFSERHRKLALLAERSHCPEFCKLYRADSALGRLENIIKSSQDIPETADSEVDNPHFI